jgi:Arc-like DNA binding domain
MKKQRRPGGGRKAQGELRQLTATMSVRMPRDLRDQLERARQASGRSLSQELLWRAAKSFDRDRGLSRERAMRAFCFLFSELAQVIAVNPELVPDWRFDPWLFQAFKMAVGKLLDRFQPAGKMTLPEFWQFVREAPDASGLPPNKEERERITESPEAMADYAVRNVLSGFNSPQRVGHLYGRWKGLEEKMTDTSHKRIAGRLTRELGATYYGMINAQQDLAPKPKSQGGNREGSGR